MHKPCLVSLTFLVFLFLVPPFARAEREVEVRSVDARGFPKQESPSQEQRVNGLPSNEKGKELLIEDFESGEPVNLAGGARGDWNVTPDDPDTSVQIEIAQRLGAGGSGNALKVNYRLNTDAAAKVGFWTQLKNLDARRYDHLVFDVRGDEQGHTDVFVVELKKYKDEQRVDKIRGSHVVRGVTSKWQTVSIPLHLFTGLFDQTNPAVWRSPSLAQKDLDELVVTLENRRVSQKIGALYFDNFKFVRTGQPGMNVMQQPEQKGLKTPVRLGGVAYARFLVKRLRGYPSTLHPKKVFPSDDREFLTMIARDTWRFFEDVVDREHHLPLDTIQLGRAEPIAPDGRIGDYTSVTNLGLYLMCVVSAYDFGFISREEAIQRIGGTLDTLDQLERHESGFLYNYYDTTTLERTSYFVSLVDSGWLDAGMYVVKHAFPEAFGARCDRFLGSHRYSFFYDDVEQQMSHGYYSHLGVPSDYTYGSLYTEARLASYMAIGRGDAPIEHWFRLVRTFPENYAWQTQIPIDRRERETLGFRYLGGYFEWKGIRFLPSWGGSMFEALMPALVLDEAKYAPQGLGLNDLNQATIHIRYTLEDLGYPVWGMSPSSVPEGDYSEFGVPVLGAKGYKTGVVTPHASVLAIEWKPEETIRNLRALVKQYPIYGEYGFYDSVNVKTGLVAHKYLALDQAMILIALNNYVNDGAIRKRFHLDPIHERARALLAEEKLFE